LVGQIRDQHDLIESVIGSFFHWIQEGQETDPEAGATFLAFFKDWVGDFHHALEEQLFALLAERADIALDRGPVMVLREEHRKAEKLFESVARAENRGETRAFGVELCHLLWLHVDKENSVMLPEAGERLVRSGAGDVTGRAPSDADEKLRRTVLEVVERWQPWDDDDVYRGDGCMVCDAYGNVCGGIEKEWWNAWEWDYHKSFQG
jgi:hemerythrin-like domain-containing protein